MWAILPCTLLLIPQIVSNNKYYRRQWAPVATHFEYVSYCTWNSGCVNKACRSPPVREQLAHSNKLPGDFPSLAYRLGSIIYDRHINAFLATSLLLVCQPAPQRICTALATFFESPLLQLIHYAPLFNATCSVYGRLFQFRIVSPI